MSLENFDYDITKTSYPQPFADPRADIVPPAQANTTALIQKDPGDTIYGSNQQLPEVNAASPETTNGPAIGRKSKNPDAPTAASQSNTIDIHTALNTANPNNQLGTLSTIVQGIIMIKMIDGLTSPAGITSMVGGILGQAFQQLAQATGINNIIGQISSLTSGAISAGLLSSVAQNAISLGLQSTATTTPVGILATSSVANAQTVNGLITQSGAASIGGPILGISNTSIESLLATAPVGQIVSITTPQYTIIGINTSPYPTSTIPSFTGLEAVSIANSQVNTAFSSISSSLTSPIIFASAINGLITNVISQGLQAIFGSTINNLLGNAASLLGSVGSLLNLNATNNIQNTLQLLGINGQPSYLSQQNAVQKMAIAEMKYKIALAYLNGQGNNQALETSIINQAIRTGQTINYTNSTGSQITVTPSNTTPPTTS